MLQNNSILEDETQPQEETQTDDLIYSDSEEPPMPVIRPLPSKDTFDGGLLIVWGCGEFGQHGHGHSEDVPCCDAIGSPLWLGQDRMVVEVACGSSHTLILTDDNKVYSWGNSNSGQLGVGTTETSPHPRPLNIGVSSGTKLRGITCGTRHSFVWTQDGDCFSFGNNYSAQLGYDFRKPDFKENQLKPIFVDTLLRRPVSQVACGARHSVFLFTNGQVAAVGVNNRGQIGCGDTVDAICPKTIPDLPAISIIACGNSHNIAADVHGSVYVWGYSKACGSRTDVLSPLSVHSCSEQDSVVDMAGGDSHSIILTSSGTVYSWGNNFEGQLGQGKSVKFLSKPTELSSSLLPGKVISVSVGENTCAAVTEDGKLYLWGKNASQVIRDDESSRFFQFEPYHVPLGVWKALKVSCGSWHVACVVCANQENEINEVREEKSEINSINAEIEVECGYLDSLNNQRNDKQKIELNMESKAVVGEKSSVAPAVSLSDDEPPFSGHRRVASDLIFDENQGRIELIPAVANGELKNSEKVIVQQVNSSHSAGEDNCDKEVKEDSAFDDKAVGDTSYFKPMVQQILEEKPAVIETSKIGEKPDHVLKVMNEEKPALSLNIVTSFDDASAEEINKQVAEKTNEDCASKESDNTEDDFAAFNGKSETVEAAYLEEEKPAVNSKEITSHVAGVRAHSEQRSGTDSHLVSQDISSTLRSGSLESMKLYRQQEDITKDSRTSRLTYSPPANARSPVGHLRREKKPARMLRHASFEADYHLPNQPVRTVDINITPYHLRPHPPINRTQSSPSLYSSNLIRSPVGARRKSSASAKVPRPLTSGLNSDEGLPPRPPGRGVRRPQLNPVFSSGTSWRKRK